MSWPYWHRKARRRIARIELTGPIAGTTRERVLKALKQVEERRFPALLLRIDSPGGTVGDSQEIHAALLRLRDKKCHVVASFGNISASGGVYIGVAAQEIVANAGTITGSIGVILRGSNLSELLRRIGVSFETVKSGRFKDILAPDRALAPEERTLLQALIDSSYGQFVQAVAVGRKLDPAQVRAFADGRVFSGEQARELGLVDHLGDEDFAQRRAAELAGLNPDKAPCVTLGTAPKGLSRFLPGSRLLSMIMREVELEVLQSGAPLWLFRP
ncbi:MAG: signal peptide peptidase SppA [Aphanocapsa feldmannii 277cV]|uniref:Signal peptide peptidase SppA n=1 Tax=Aphanocapsa feldmannii 277cV TaxID=2507553 RepID=A0A524RQ93_9CHRO|nr:MAG: signal peptide peptidase SppA [Aphanocapsa feldmannii 288cV]TGG94611.1 MAG: signal peptide peptidase SppA [Aphanocapsa feldmannii 277cV]